MTQGDLQNFFKVSYAAINVIPDELPEVAEALQRGRQFYEQDQDPQHEPARQSNRERNSHVPPEGIGTIPGFLYLKPIEINQVPQVGLFSDRPLAAGTWIGTYTGKLLPGAHPSQSLYAMLFEDPNAGVSLQIDALNHGNHMRFMNHSDSPNVQPAYLFHQGMYYVGMRTKCAVEAHHQLLYNYSKAYWEKLGIKPIAL